MFALFAQKNQPKSGFNPLPANFTLSQPEAKPMMDEQKQEPAFQPRNDFELKPKSSYREDYASQYPPPYQAATSEKRPPSPDEKEDINEGWL